MARIDNGVKPCSGGQWPYEDIVDVVVDDHTLGLIVKRAESLVEAIILVASMAWALGTMAREVEDEGVSRAHAGHKPPHRLHHVPPSWYPVRVLLLICNQMKEGLD